MMYQKPTLTVLAAHPADILLTSPTVTLQNGDNAALTSLRSFNWNE